MSEAKARELLQACADELAHVRVFVTSREKMHPDGVKLFVALRERLTAYLAPVPAPAEPTGATIRCPRCGTKQEIEFHYARVTFDAITDNASGSTEGRADDTQGGSVRPPDVCVSVAGNGRGCGRPERSARGVASGSQKPRSEAGTAEAGIESGPLAPICAAPAAEPALTRDEQDAIRRQLYVPAAEPVAQQPPHEDGSDLDRACANATARVEAIKARRQAAQQPPPPDTPHEVLAIIERKVGREMEAIAARLAAAPQPEAPTLADDLARDLRLLPIYRMLAREIAVWTERAAARIESDAKRIRELEADLGRYMMLANTNATDLAASRERERAERERADRLWQECENLRVSRQPVDKSGDSQGRAVDKASNSQDRMRRCFGCEGFYLPACGHTCAHTTIPPEVATPDSAASPTGGEG